MNFLSQVGKWVVTIVGLLAGVLPTIRQNSPSAAATVQSVSDKLSQGLNVIMTVEQIFAAAFGPDAKLGSDKLKAALPQVAALIQNTDVLLGKHPKDEAKFTAAVTALTSALADVLNSYGY